MSKMTVDKALVAVGRVVNYAEAELRFSADESDREMRRDALNAIAFLREMADQAPLTDADTERLVAHGEHLKDLEENR